MVWWSVSRLSRAAMHRQSGPSTHHSKVDVLRAIADEKGRNPARGAIA